MRQALSMFGLVGLVIAVIWLAPNGKTLEDSGLIRATVKGNPSIQGCLSDKRRAQELGEAIITEDFFVHVGAEPTYLPPSHVRSVVGDVCHGDHVIMRIDQNNEPRVLYKDMRWHIFWMSIMMLLMALILNTEKRPVTLGVIAVAVWGVGPLALLINMQAGWVLLLVILIGVTLSRDKGHREQTTTLSGWKMGIMGLMMTLSLAVCYWVLSWMMGVNPHEILLMESLLGVNFLPHHGAISVWMSAGLMSLILLPTLSQMEWPQKALWKEVWEENRAPRSQMVLLTLGIGIWLMTIQYIALLIEYGGEWIPSGHPALLQILQLLVATLITIGLMHAFVYLIQRDWERVLRRPSKKEKETLKT